MVEYNLEKEIERDKLYTVAKANDLVREAKYNLSLGQQRVLNFLISKIPPDANSLDDVGSKQRLGYISFQVQEFARVFGMDEDSGTTYAHVKDWLLDLKQKAWWVFIDGKDVIMSWLDNVEMEPKSGKCSVTFYNLMEPYLVALTKTGNYTSYNLLYTTNFRSAYSGRFYEMFKSYEFRSKVRSSQEKNVKVVVMDLEELKSSFDEKDLKTKKVIKTLSGYTYKDFKRILDKSLSEINQYTDINVEYESIKKGKKVVQLRFTIQSVLGMELLDRMTENKMVESGMKEKGQIPGQMNIFTPTSVRIDPM